MYISKELVWLKPYLDKAIKDFGVYNILSVRKYTPSKSSTKQQSSLATVLNDGKSGFRIVLQVLYKDQGKFRKISNRQLLSSLAHELAHIHFWDHKTDFEKLRKKIAHVFYSMLKK